MESSKFINGNGYLLTAQRKSYRRGVVGHSTFSSTLPQIQRHPPRPFGILEVLIFILLIGLLRRHEQHRIVVQSQGNQPVVFEFLKIFIHNCLIVSKRCGGLLTIPRGGSVTMLRAAGLRSLPVSWASASALLLLFTQPRIVEGYTLCQLPL